MRFHEIIAEAGGRELLPVQGHVDGLPAHRNPTAPMLLRLLGQSREQALRGLIVGPDVYWCDAALAIHHDMAEALGVSTDNNRLRLMLEVSQGTPYLGTMMTDKAIVDHPNLRRILVPEITVYSHTLDDVVPGDEFLRAAGVALVEGAAPAILDEIAVGDHNSIGQVNDRDGPMDVERWFEIKTPFRQPIGHLNGLELQATTWPLSGRPMVFFVNNVGKPVGYAILYPTNPYDPVDKFLVKLIYLLPEVRKAGLAPAFYKFLLDNGVEELYSDKLQSFGSQKVWAKLATTPGYEVWTVAVEDDHFTPLERVSDTSGVYGNDLRLMVRKGA